MRRGLTRPLAAAALLLAACSSGAPAQRSPSPLPSLASASPFPSPSPEALQRMEPSLPAAVEEAAAAAAGGKLYVMGGFNAAGQSLSTVYVFDGTTWSTGPRLPLAVDHPSAATLDDHVYIAGGHSNGRDTPRVFRLDGDSWTEVAPMHYARGGHALVSAVGRLYAIGGNTASGNVGPTESYNPATNGWNVLADLPSPRNHLAGFSVDDVACVAGGRSPNTTRVDCLLLVTGVWSRPISDVPSPTSGGGAVAFPNGDVIAAGGEDAGESRIIDQLVYLRGASWVSAGTMLSPRHGFQLAIFNGRAWACGGGSAAGLHPVATCTSLGDAAAS
ncbi:MAG: hypothetical protein E6I36_00930 [Chloroflexi bacterium]|nr:MAG: hypothetical protein E6I36_00930 [Chloroflexota bacterium]